MRKRSSDVIERFNDRTSVVDIISNQSPLCSEIGDSIVKGKELGFGNYAIVWSTELKDKEDYIAVKIPHDSLEIIDVKFEESGEKLDRFASKNSEFNEHLIIKLNGDNPNRIIKKGDILRVPKFSRRCLTKDDVSLKEITIPKGSYLCRNAIYSEFLIGLLCSGLSKSRSINFMDIMDLSMCPESSRKTSYMFQEKMIGALGDGLIKMNDSILIQVFHAIACYQENYAISHNDLHVGNIFYTKYVGLEETTHLAFVLDDIILYIPKPDHIIKIGDFGQSCKYSDYMILNCDIVDSTYPNYSAFYDLGTSIMSILLIDPNTLLLKCITYILQDDMIPESRYLDFIQKNDPYHRLTKYFSAITKRPRFDMLDKPPFSDMSAYKLLRSSVFSKFRNKPIGNIVTVARI
uniref:Protein kinase n=1 Tax=Pithovirus LCPAC406 TaxID=2506599 RepID=A0A481ZE40_9VIRU|nr:MAG: protein kinase [Pithovirus LCPAC406]